MKNPNEPGERPEMEALRKDAGFPPLDPARDARMKGALRAALKSARLRAGARRWSVIRWSAVGAAAATVLIALAVLSYMPDRARFEGYDAKDRTSLNTNYNSAFARKQELETVPATAANVEYTRFFRYPPERELVALSSVTRADPSSPTWKRSRLVPNASRLLVGEKEELPLKAFQADVRVDGFRARVLIDLWFLNDRGRPLEGSFSLRLPDGASPYFFAFGEEALAVRDPTPALFADAAGVRKRGSAPDEVLRDRASRWTAVKEARMVPREKAALAYRETVRRSVDPALLEWSGAGVFSARVFPLAPGRLERIVIGYDLDLVPAGDGLELRFDLPEGVVGATVDLSAAGLDGVALATVPDAEAERGGGRLHWRFVDPAGRAVVLRTGAPGAIAICGDDPRTAPLFAARFRPEIPPDGDGTASPRAVFLVDTSLSSNPEKFNVWVKLLGAILDRNRDVLKEFAVLFFDVGTSWWREGYSPNDPAAVKALLERAGSLSLEGATDLGAALAEAVRPSWAKDPSGPPPDLFLLSDGAATWGEDEPEALAGVLRSGGAGPLFAFATGLGGGDPDALARLARASGGAVFAVTGDADVEKAAGAHRSRPWRIAGLSLEGASDLLLAGRPESIYSGQDLLLAGRGAPAAGAGIVLSLRRGDEAREARATIVRALPSELAPRAYGAIAVGHLEEFPGSAGPIAKAYATHFRVTGRTCSLLMLETEEDYRRFGIAPEEDAFVVKSTPASAAADRAREELGAALAGPKARFLAWLERLRGLPGLEIGIETALRVALDALPPAAFETAPAPLRAGLRSWDDVPGRIQEMLASGDLDHDAIAAEAARRRGAGGAGDALRALSSLVEANPGDAVLGRDVAASALEWGLGGQALGLLRRAAGARPWEPEGYRALAGCLAEMGKADLAIAHFEVALSGKWDERHGEFRSIAGLEYIHLLRGIERGEVPSGIPDFARTRLGTLGPDLDPGMADLVVAIGWNTDGTDVDLHVTESSGEECSYQHPETRSGGRISRDVTTGYGPELYILKSAPPGKYRIDVRYYASDRNRASVRTKVQALVYEGWGTPRERVTRKTATLLEGKQVQEILTVTVEK